MWPFYSLWMVFFTAKACSLNHCNKPDPSQSFDSSETGLPSFCAARLDLAREETKRLGLTNADLQSAANAPPCFVHSVWSQIGRKVKMDRSKFWDLTSEDFCEQCCKCLFQKNNTSHIILMVSGMKSWLVAHSSVSSISPLTLLSEYKQYSGSAHGASLCNTVPLSCSRCLSREDKTF